MAMDGLKEHFNSQPHEEADVFDDATNLFEGDFNSQPHEEADRRAQSCTDDLYAFQLTASRRG